jgi:hypothetical protein
MTEPNEPTTDARREPDPPRRTPFDNPYFLPVLLLLFALWFGYDGWFNPNIKAVMFNRVGFPILLLLSLYFFVQTLRDARRKQDAPQDGGDRPGT